MINKFVRIKNFVNENFISGLKSKNKMTRNVSLLYLYSFFIRMNFALPIELLFFASLSNSYSDAMKIFFIAHMTGTILGVPLGLLSDKVGRKKVAILCSFCRLLAAILYASAGSYSALIVAALFSGFYRFSAPNADTFLFESLASNNQVDKYHDCLSKMKSVSSFSLSVGALLCGVFYYFLSLRGVMVMKVIPMFLAFIISLLLKEGTVKKEAMTNPFKHLIKAFSYFKRNKKLFCFAIADSTHYGLNEASYTINAAFFKTIMPVELLGVLRFFGHLVSSVTSYLSSKVGKIIGVEKTILLGAMSDNLVNVFSVLCANWLSPIFKTIGSGCFGIYSPATGSFIQKEISNDERATLVSFTTLLNTGFYSIGTLLIGWLADLYSPHTAMLIGYSSALILNSLFVVAFKQKSIKTVS